MKYALTFVAILGSCLAPWPVSADVTISDWRGVTVTAQEGTVDSGGVTIVYHAAGEGPLVILVHSITGPWFDWRHQIVGLSEHYRVVAMSTRGTDTSGKPAGVEAYAMAKISGDIRAIIDLFGEDRATIVGQDSGGFFAWHFAMTYPERTERLISVGTVHPAGLINELAANPEQQQASTFQRGMQENPNAASEFGARIRNRPAHPDDPPELARLRSAAYERLDAESIVNFYKANWPRPPFTTTTTTTTEGFGFRVGEFPLVQAPTLLIYGGESRPFKPGTLNDTGRWVEGPLTLHTLPGVGHGPHTEAPEVVTPLILDWLSTPR